MEEREIVLETEKNEAEILSLEVEMQEEQDISLEKEFSVIGSGGYLVAGENISIVDGVISVQTATDVEEDNTKPVTSAAVYAEVGNINILLQTI